MQPGHTHSKEDSYLTNTTGYILNVEKCSIFFTMLIIMIGKMMKEEDDLRVHIAYKLSDKYSPPYSYAIISQQQ
jgi:hypothetical protein